MSDNAASQTNDGTGNGTAVSDAKPTWIEQLPEDMRGDESLHGHATIGDYVKANNTLATEREGLIKVPGEEATDEDKNAFALKMGRPETAEGYNLSKPSEWPEGVAYDENLEAAYRSVAFEMGLSGDKANQLYNWYNKMSIEGHAANAEADKVATEKSVNALKDVWKGDDFKVNTELAGRAYTKYADEEGQKFLEETVVNGVALGDHPVFLKIFKKISDVTSDDNMNVGRDSAFNESSDETKAKERFPNTEFK